jgi:hypothetical protein
MPLTDSPKQRYNTPFTIRVPSFAVSIFTDSLPLLTFVRRFAHAYGSARPDVRGQSLRSVSLFSDRGW